MISSGKRNIIQLLSILLLLNIVLGVYEPPYGKRPPSALSNQRSADNGYKYAWFTRDIHDDVNADEDSNNQERPLPLLKTFRMNPFKNILNRKYQNNDDNVSESNEKL